jgi:prepilin-type N-terminal cleavage/methylation domain-containing protein
MREMGGQRKVLDGRRAFTLIEVLAVIAIIMGVMALAVPNFIAIMKSQRWSAAVSKMQAMVWRARALAANAHKDISVEFDVQGDNGTCMWLESESNDLERVPDLDVFFDYLDNYWGFNQFLQRVWVPAGGTYDVVPANNKWGSKFTNFQINYTKSKPEQYGDNARQSEVVELAYGLTIDSSPTRSPYFINWDARTSVMNYGWDTHNDIRIGPNGALVQTHDATICVKQIRGEEYRQVWVIRCTGRLVPAN